jgi:hypothetical protein
MPVWWPLLITLIQEFRTFLQLREEGKEEARKGFVWYLTTQWDDASTVRGRIASRAMEKYLETTDAPDAEVQRQMEEGLEAILGRPLTEQWIAGQLREAAAMGAEVDEEALGVAAKEMAGELSRAGGSPMEGILLELLLEVKLRLGGGVSEEDEELIVRCLADVARRRPFRLGHIEHETRGFYVMPPIKCDELPDGPDPVARVSRYLSSGGPSRLFIRGPAGIGKTRFVAEVTRRLADEEREAIPLFAAPEKHAEWTNSRQVFGGVRCRRPGVSRVSLHIWAVN